MGVFEHYQERFDAALEEELSLQDYLELCKSDPSVYATAAERLLMAIGEPEFVDTSKDPRLSRIFSNKIIKRYPAFNEFYGMEEAIEQIVSFFRHAAQGLEERKQILYLLGPVGGGKSSLAEKLKSLMQRMPFYAIAGSPLNESPLGLFDPVRGWRHPLGGVRHPVPLSARRHVALGGQASGGVRGRHHPVQGGEEVPVAAESDCRREDRAR